MRVMVLVKASAESEAGVMPTSDELNEMGQYNERLVKAGIMLAGEGITPTSKGKRIRFADRATTVVDGPFAETKEIVSGFWIWEVASMDEAVEWLKQAPFKDAELELRKIFDAEDFGAEFTPEMQEAEQKLRDRIAEQAD